MKKEYSQNMQSENKYGEYVPSIPYGFYTGFGVRCSCGRKFRNEENYAGHYALWHILGLKEPKAK